MKFSLSHPLRLVVEASVPYLRGIIDSVAEVTYLPSDDFSSKNIQSADALIIRSITKCTPDLLRGTNVKLITTATAGFDHIDRNYCEANGILWRNSPGCNATAVAQYVMSSLCRLALRDHFSLKEMTLGIIGVGHVGKELLRLSTAYGMKVLLCDPPRAAAEQDDSFLSLEQLAQECDILSFHVPLTKDEPYPTYHMINDLLLDKCKDKRPILINACRGAVADTKALIQGIQKSYLRALVVDCWEGEPDINTSLLAITDIATPHIAGFSADGKANGARMCVEAISEIFDIDFPLLPTLSPPAPDKPLIDLTEYTGNRIEQALLRAFDPMIPDHLLRKDPKQFEQLRKNYHYPREMKAFTVKGATDIERTILQKMDFNA